MSKECTIERKIIVFFSGFPCFWRVFSSAFLLSPENLLDRVSFYSFIFHPDPCEHRLCGCQLSEKSSWKRWLCAAFGCQSTRHCSQGKQLVIWYHWFALRHTSAESTKRAQYHVRAFCESGRSWKKAQNSLEKGLQAEQRQAARLRDTIRPRVAEMDGDVQLSAEAHMRCEWSPSSLECVCSLGKGRARRARKMGCSTYCNCATEYNTIYTDTIYTEERRLRLRRGGSKRDVASVTAIGWLAGASGEPPSRQQRLEPPRRPLDWSGAAIARIPRRLESTACNIGYRIYVQQCTLYLYKIADRCRVLHAALRCARAACSMLFMLCSDKQSAALAVVRFTLSTLLLRHVLCSISRPSFLPGLRWFAEWLALLHFSTSFSSATLHDHERVLVAIKPLVHSLLIVLVCQKIKDPLQEHATFFKDLNQ